MEVLQHPFSIDSKNSRKDTEGPFEILFLSFEDSPLKIIGGFRTACWAHMGSMKELNYRKVSLGDLTGMEYVMNHHADCVPGDLNPSSVHHSD